MVALTTTGMQVNIDANIQYSDTIGFYSLSLLLIVKILSNRYRLVVFFFGNISGKHYLKYWYIGGLDFFSFLIPRYVQETHCKPWKLTDLKINK